MEVRLYRLYTERRHIEIANLTSPSKIYACIHHEVGRIRVKTVKTATNFARFVQKKLRSRSFWTKETPSSPTRSKQPKANRPMGQKRLTTLHPLITGEIDIPQPPLPNLPNRLTKRTPSRDKNLPKPPPRRHDSANLAHPVRSVVLGRSYGVVVATHHLGKNGWGSVGRCSERVGDRAEQKGEPSPCHRFPKWCGDSPGLGRTSLLCLQNEKHRKRKDGW